MRQPPALMETWAYIASRLGARSMRPHAYGRLRRQVAPLRREVPQGGELPFADALSSGGLTGALAEIERPWNDRIFTPSPTNPAAPPAPA